jgi:hypothetical protein
MMGYKAVSDELILPEFTLLVAVGNTKAVLLRRGVCESGGNGGDFVRGGWELLTCRVGLVEDVVIALVAMEDVVVALVAVEDVMTTVSVGSAVGSTIVRKSLREALWFVLQCASLVLILLPDRAADGDNELAGCTEFEVGECRD